VLAALLGQQGHRVLLLEKALFPSDTLHVLHKFSWYCPAG
jgi:2-polyprenyl-6-methoxyphenol hydroxylase-like FAD-dependent oxidoreductase